MPATICLITHLYIISAVVMAKRAAFRGLLRSLPGRGEKARHGCALPVFWFGGVSR
jgi:hypothetical protein